MRQQLLTGALIFATIFLTACETMTTSRRVAVSSNENWVILPVENLSQTPLAGNRAKSLVETHLRAQGVRNVEIYKPESEQSLLSLLDDAGQLATAKQWAKDNGYVYGITGSVQEWQYKNGLDNEPSIALTLKFIQLQTDEVMWVASTTRTGWGYNNLAGVASKAIAELMDEVAFRESRQVTRVARVTPAQTEIPALSAPAPVSGPLPAVTNPVAAAALPQAKPALVDSNGNPITPITPYPNIDKGTN